MCITAHGYFGLTAMRPSSLWQTGDGVLTAGVLTRFRTMLALSRRFRYRRNVAGRQTASRARSLLAQPPPGSQPSGLCRGSQAASPHKSERFVSWSSWRYIANQVRSYFINLFGFNLWKQPHSNGMAIHDRGVQSLPNIKLVRLETEAQLLPLPNPVTFGDKHRQPPLVILLDRLGDITGR
jgi:hypothetical protein